MSEYMHLIGADDVRAAGSSMRTAAETMQRAANSIEESLRRHAEFLDDWLLRLENVLEKETKP